MSRRLGALILLGLGAPAGAAEAPANGGPLAERGSPSTYRVLDAGQAARFRRGQEVFRTQWVPSGTAGAAGRTGVGPLFNAASCDSCHENGAHGHGPVGDGPAPPALVIKLKSPAAANDPDPAGDPVYGRVFNTVAHGGVQSEGVVTVRYREIVGTYYPGGGQWRVREPQYQLLQLHYGPLAPTTIVQPRLAPALFGLGLLEAVPDAAIVGAAANGRSEPRRPGEPALYSRAGSKVIGRFGWQGNSLSVRDQTTKAFALEMGLTTSDRPADDCTSSQVDCLRLADRAAPEVADESLEALVAFVKWLAVPAPRADVRDGDAGPRLFAALGCESCHRSRLPVEIAETDGPRPLTAIAPYTDLRLHDLGDTMADRDVSGKAVPSKWRTAPLWGLGDRIAREGRATFLHDGRARSAEEAILWHFGEGARSQRRFTELLPQQRAALLRWLERL